jgi:hypothetical protein
MKMNAEHLYELLPAIYRIKDGQQGEPLKALLTLIAEEAMGIEENLEQLYDDQFIETSANWVVPYIGDLIGYRSLHGVAKKIASQRAEVANTIGYRRRKGTAAMLEQLARDVTGWNARVVEYFQLLITTQYMNHLRASNHYSPNLRDWEPLEHYDTAFDTLPRSVDVRKIARGEGRHNIPNIGIFLWRLNAYSLRESLAGQIQVDERRYMFSPLGNNTQLFTFPETEDEVTHLAEPVNVPNPISRRMLDAYTSRYYGKGKSILLRVDGRDIPIEEVRACNLSNIDESEENSDGLWAHEPTDFYAIDPELGRIACPKDSPAPTNVVVNFHYGFSADMGGGEYERAETYALKKDTPKEVKAPNSIQVALNAVQNGGAVQIIDNELYKENLSLHVNAAASPEKSHHVELRAKNGFRPTLELRNNLEITGGLNSVVTLNGLLITGKKIIVPKKSGNQLKLLRLVHCTLVPGLKRKRNGNPEKPDEPSLVVEAEGVDVELDHCIVGGIRTVSTTKISITDSIVDAMDPTSIALMNVDGNLPGGHLKLIDSTVIGKVHAQEMPLVSNSIFFSMLAGNEWPAPVMAERKQAGCVRFSYVPHGSPVPRRFRCQPSLSIQEALEAAKNLNGTLSPTEEENIVKGIVDRMVPGFTSLKYGEPGYGQLRMSSPEEIRTEADDESEMGAFHKLYQPQKETNLRVRLDEYLRFGLEAGLFYAT